MVRNRPFCNYSVCGVILVVFVLSRASLPNSYYPKVPLVFLEQNRYYRFLIAFALPCRLWNNGGER
jgi:hypothetical protein